VTAGVGVGPAHTLALALAEEPATAATITGTNTGTKHCQSPLTLAPCARGPFSAVDGDGVGMVVAPAERGELLPGWSPLGLAVDFGAVAAFKWLLDQHNAGTKFAAYCDPELLDQQAVKMAKVCQVEEIRWWGAAHGRLLGRYAVHGTAHHTSANCCVVFATDLQRGDQSVALKFLHDEATFLREIACRAAINANDGSGGGGDCGDGGDDGGGAVGVHAVVDHAASASVATATAHGGSNDDASRTGWVIGLLDSYPNADTVPEADEAREELDDDALAAFPQIALSGSVVLLAPAVSPARECCLWWARVRAEAVSPQCILICIE